MMRVTPYVQELQNHTPIAEKSGGGPAGATAAFKGLSPGAPFSWYGETRGFRPYPLKPVGSQAVKFGMLPHPPCGICPFCVASGLAEAEVAKIGELRKGEGLFADGGDIRITPGEASDSIRRQGSATGVKAQRAAIGNEDGTRLQPLAVKDASIYSVAALPRIYDAGGQFYTINGDPKKGLKGTENGLYRSVVGGQVISSASDGETFSYPCKPGDPAAPIEDPKRPLLGEFRKPGRAGEIDVKTYGIYHHISEGYRVRNERNFHSLPMLAGYASLSQVKADELFVLSVRELPRFEFLGVEAGGLMNAMGLAAKREGIRSVMVLVEPWQKGLRDYIEKELRDRYGYAVEEVPQASASKEYHQVIQRLDVEPASVLYRIPLDKLKAAWAEVDRSEPLGEQDTAMLETIRLKDAIKADTDDERPRRRNLDNCPVPGEITAIGGGQPEIPEDELLDLEIPDIPGLAEQ